MTAPAGIGAVQARIGAIESRLGVARSRAAQMGSAPVLNDQTGASVSAPPLGFADVAATVDDQLGALAGAAGVGDFAGSVRPMGVGTTAVYNPLMGAAPAAGLATTWSGPDAVGAAVPHASTFNAAGARWGIPPTVLAGMAYVESRFRNDVVSEAGAVGMMQFLPTTAASMGVNPLDTDSAIDGAARYLRNALDRFGSLDMAIGAYNIGPGAMARAGAVVPGTQADRYVAAVKAAAGRMS